LIHFDSLPFPGLTTALTSNHGGSHKTGVPMQPTSEHSASLKFASLPGQIRENDLSHVRCQGRISVQPPAGRPIYQAEIVRNDRPKRLLVALFGVSAKI